MINEAVKQGMDTERPSESMLASLYDEYYDRIARYAYVRIGNRDDSQDLASEVFLKALNSLKSYKERGVPMQAWLFRIAHNLVVDYLRQKKVKMVSVDALNLVDDNDPAGIAEIKIEFERVTKTMEKLTEEQREVIRLRFFGGLTSREAGKVLNKSDGAVREMQRAAMEKLRFLLVAG